MTQIKGVYNCTNYLTCGNSVDKFKHLKKLNGGYYCEYCAKERRLENRRKIEEKYKEAWKKQDERRIAKRQVILPKIESIKKIKSVRNKNGIYLSKDERDFLYNKYVAEGRSSDEASIKVNRTCEKMRELVVKLKDQKKPEEEISRRFKEEFAKLIEK